MAASPRGRSQGHDIHHKTKNVTQRQALGEEKGGGWEKWMEIVLKVKFAQIGFVHAKACHPINTK